MHNQFKVKIIAILQKPPATVGFDLTGPAHENSTDINVTTSTTGAASVNECVPQTPTPKMIDNILYRRKQRCRMVSHRVSMS
jgi:hypothetical protein